jgi:DNA-binding HxlR family transcriptional regulator
VRRRDLDGCPIAGALQLIGNKWSMLIVRDLCVAPKRTTELLSDLHPISSRTLMDRLRDMEQDKLILRHNLRGLPRHVEYELTERGRKLIPLLDALLQTGRVMECNECEDRNRRLGYYCDFCPLPRGESIFIEEPQPAPSPARAGRPKDDSIVLL